MDDLFGDVLGSSSSSTSMSVPSTATSSAAVPVEEEYESALFVARECFVYKLPPRTATAGYKAGEWVCLCLARRGMRVDWADRMPR